LAIFRYFEDIATQLATNNPSVSQFLADNPAAASTSLSYNDMPIVDGLFGEMTEIYGPPPCLAAAALPKPQDRFTLILDGWDGESTTKKEFEEYAMEEFIKQFVTILTRKKTATELKG
jgi:hypothetical protein